MNRTRSKHISEMIMLLTMLTFGLGLIVGNKIGELNQQITSQTSAQNTKIDIIETHQENDTDYELIQEPVNIHNEACFPMGNTENPIVDPYCRIRLFPPSLVYIDSPILDRIQRERSQSNPHIIKTTQNNDVTINIYGSLCLNSRTLPRTQLTTDSTEIFLSLFPVRKYKGRNNSVGIIPNDINYAIAGLIASAEDNRGSTRDTVSLVNHNAPVCEFISGRDIYRNESNTIVFDVKLSKNLLIDRIENTFEKSSLSTNVITKPFDKKDCSVYIHLQSLNPNGPRDSFNLVRIPLQNILEKEDVQKICTQPSPTPTIQISPSPTIEPSMTPTTPPTPSVSPTIEPQIVGCFEKCSADTEILQCGNDPTSSRPIKMECYALSDTTLPKVKGLCEVSSKNCQCLPARCEDPAINCLTQSSACTIPTITIVQRPSSTPTPTSLPSPTPQTACRFEALAFVQQCTEWIDKSKGICKRDQNNRYIGKPIFGSVYQIQQNPPQHILEAPWQTLNDKNNKGTLTYYLSSTASSQKFNFSHGFTGNHVYIDDWDIPRRGEIPPNGYNGYKEGDHALISASIDTSHYQFLPNGGKEIRTCTQGCDESKFDSTIAPNLIDGLTIVCNQEVSYGWTLQKCEQTFDIVVVVDTSTSMINFNDPYVGGRKLDVLKNTLKTFFLEKLRETGADNRIALIQFNQTSEVRSDFSQNVNTLISQVDTGLKVKEGTCIECGINEAFSLITRRQDKSRRPFVIILTDGLPNSNPGGSPPVEGYVPGVLRSADQLRLIPNITVASIGYGDTKVDPRNLPAGQFYDQIIKPIASNPSWAFSTDTNISGQAGPLPEVYSKIQTLINSCSIASINYGVFMKSKDLNNDGTINSFDVLILFENYFKDGNDIKEDINEDGIVNSLDLTLIFEDYGHEIEN